MKFRNLGPALGFCGVCAWQLAGAATTAAQTTPGVTEKEVIIGSCSALEGPSSALGRQTVAGAKAYHEPTPLADGRARPLDAPAAA